MDNNHLNSLIGANLKTIREQRGLSLDKAAKQTGVSKPMLGQIERGVSNPTVSTLWKIATGLSVPFTSFLEENESAVKTVRKQELEPIAEDSGRYLVYPIFPMEGEKPFEMFSILLKPGCRYLSDPHPRGVEEQIWVESGRFSLTVDDKTNTVSAEEGIRFIADRPHIYENPNQEPCIATLLIYYPQP
ncbi:MAG TPA: XRE family transcriptional regulator [Bacillales bacterium]|nr:XRE family transcriptional regulator [Bacillales bacterium]